VYAPNTRRSAKMNPGENVKPSLRTVLADSHVAAVAIAVLLLWSLEAGAEAFSQQFTRATYLVTNALAALKIEHLTYTIRIDWLITTLNLCYAGVTLALAWFLSRWAYGAGPLCVFRCYYVRLSGRGRA
jgi:hypothetical protein